MNKNYIIPNEWSIIEEGFDRKNVESSESLFSIGNGSIGQRANFEEDYSGNTFQGSYIGGIYYPDKTRVGWWKNGYPEYFAKVLNAPNWIGIDVTVNGQELDLNKCKIIEFRRELDMKEGILNRTFLAELEGGDTVKVNSKRFLSMKHNEVGVIKYSVTPINFDGEISFSPYIDAGIMNEDANYDEYFWEILDSKEEQNEAYILSKTLKTEFHVCTGMKVEMALNDFLIDTEKEVTRTDKKIRYSYKTEVKSGDTFTLFKYGGYVQSMNHPKGELFNASKRSLNEAAQ